MLSVIPVTDTPNVKVLSKGIEDFLARGNSSGKRVASIEFSVSMRFICARSRSGIYSFQRFLDRDSVFMRL
jgi:hypothetical protein